MARYRTFAPISMTLHRRLWQLAWPLILSNITVPLLGLVDTAVLGHLDSPVYLGAVAIGANLFTFIFWTFGFLRMGTTGLTAQAWGASDQDRLYIELLRALVVAGAIGAVLFANQFWLLPVGLELMQTSAELWPQASLYAAIRIYSAPAVLIQYAIMGWLIGCQRTRAALFLAVTTNVVNIVLDLWLVVGLGMRAEGVAAASVAAEYYALVAGIWLCLRGQRDRIIGLVKTSGFWSRQAFVALLRFNTNLLVRTLLLLFVFAFFVAQGAQLGTQILAANAVLLTFLTLTSNALDGFANGAEALCGEAVGKGDLAGFHQAVRVSGFWSLITAIGIALFFGACGGWLINLLTDLPAVREQALTYLVWLVFLPLLGVWGYLFDGVFVGATQVRAMRDTIILATLGIFLPVWWFSQSLGNHGLWLALTTFFLARGGIQAVVYVRLNRRKRWLAPHRN